VFASGAPYLQTIPGISDNYYCLKWAEQGLPSAKRSYQRLKA